MLPRITRTQKQRLDERGGYRDRPLLGTVDDGRTRERERERERQREEEERKNKGEEEGEEEE